MYLVSAIVSAYKAREFIAGCLDDLLSQTIADRIEIIVIDSASPEGEGEIVREYQKRHSNIRYVRTRKRESIYAAWNRGVVLATAPYLTNANVDDRHRKDALETMVCLLDTHPDVALAYAAYYRTSRRNDWWDSGSARDEIVPPEFSRDLMLLRCYVGPQPVWRRSLHDEIGLFDESLEVAGDYEFWLRAAERHRFLRVPEVLGLYYASPERTNLEFRDRRTTREETDLVRDRYLRRYLARIDSGISFVFLGERKASEWDEVFRNSLSWVTHPVEVVAVAPDPGEVVQGWEDAGRTPSTLRTVAALSPGILQAMRGEYVVVVPPGRTCPAAVLRSLLDEVDDKGHLAGVFRGDAGENGQAQCLVFRREVFDRGAGFRGGEDARGDVEDLVPAGVEVQEISPRGWRPLRSRLFMDIRLSELDAVEHAWRTRSKRRSVPNALLRGEWRIYKELFLKGRWRDGGAGWLKAALRGWTDFLKSVYASDREGE